MSNDRQHNATLALRLPENLKRELEEVAAADRRPASYLGRVAIEEYLERRQSRTRRHLVRASAGEERS